MAEEFTVWSNQTFNAPTSGDIVATSAEINNNNGLNSVRVDLCYDEIATTVPGPISPGLTAVIEIEQDGVWVVAGHQFELINSDENTPKRAIIVSPALQVNPGVDIVAGPQAEAVRISRTQGHIGDKFRVVIYANESSNFVSLTIDGHGRKFDN